MLCFINTGHVFGQKVQVLKKMQKQKKKKKKGNNAAYINKKLGNFYHFWKGHSCVWLLHPWKAYSMSHDYRAITSFERFITLLHQSALVSQLCPQFFEKLNCWTLENRKQKYISAILTCEKLSLSITLYLARPNSFLGARAKWNKKRMQAGAKNKNIVNFQ